MLHNERRAAPIWSVTPRTPSWEPQSHPWRIVSTAWSSDFLIMYIFLCVPYFYALAVKNTSFITTDNPSRRARLPPVRGHATSGETMKNDTGTDIHPAASVNLESIGREIGARRMRSVGVAVRAVFSLASMVAATDVLAQGGPCQTSCDDGGWLPGWIVTSPGGDSGGFGGNDPCGGNWCDGGGGNDVPPDEGGYSGTPTAGNYTAPNSSRTNPNTATCQSDTADRQAHASFDVREYQVLRLASGQGLMGAGSIVEVTYDDGSKEKWIISAPQFTDPLSPVPVPGSLTGAGCTSA